MIPLFDQPLEIDEVSQQEASEERGTLTDVSPQLKMWARENVLRLLLVDVQTSAPHNGSVRTESTLRLAGAPHPDCVFTWASLSLNLNRTADAKCEEIHPLEEAAQKTTITTDLSPSLKGSVPGFELEASLGAKREISYEIMRPQLLGVNLETRVMWTFSAPTRHSDLQLNHDLILRTRYPESAPAGLRASMQLRARVAFRGFVGSIPLIGSETADEKHAVFLDRMEQ